MECIKLKSKSKKLHGVGLIERSLDDFSWVSQDLKNLIRLVAWFFRVSVFLGFRG
jgi:hypothetical protein